MLQMNDLSKQYDLLKEDINENINNVLKHGKFIMGPEVSELENKLKTYVGVKHVVTCASGTDALLMSLRAWGIGKGDAVFTTPFTFVATSEVIATTGATPVFVDIDKTTFNIDVSKLEEAINKVIKEGKLSPKLILPVDLFGLLADYEHIETIAQKYNLKILEDAAQSFGSSFLKRKSCSFGDAAATSFFPAKPLGCYGDGGAIFTNDTNMYNLLKSIRVHGKGQDKYDNVRIGMNSRLDTLQAAILLAKLKVFDSEILSKNDIANLYSEKLNNVVEIQTIPENYVSSFAQYSILAKDATERNLIQENLKKANIASAIYYSTPLHLQGAFKYLNYNLSDFKVSEDISNRIISLPMHPYLSEDEITLITDVIKNSIS